MCLHARLSFAPTNLDQMAKTRMLQLAPLLPGALAGYPDLLIEHLRSGKTEVRLPP